MAYLIYRAESIPLSSLRLSMSAILKYFAGNFTDNTVLYNPAAKALVQGLSNFPTISHPRNDRMAMCRASVSIAGHILSWPEADKVLMWTLFLVCYFGTCRVGDVCSEFARIVSEKALKWRSVHFVEPSFRITIHLGEPKSSAGRNGLPIFLEPRPHLPPCHFP